MGKSSITTQLALSLCLAGHSVGILDVDLTGPSIPRFLGVETEKITQAPGGWLPVEIHPAQTLPPLAIPPLLPTPAANNPSRPPSNTHSSGDPSTNPETPEALPTHNQPDPSATIGSLHIMSLGFLLPSRSSAVVWRGPKKTAMVRQFLTSVLWPANTDYLLIDTPPGTSDEHISLAETLLSSSTTPGQLAGAVIVTTPQAVAVSDVRKELNFCAKVGVRVLGVVENMAGYVCECCGVSTNVFGRGGGEVMSAEFEVPFLGRVPLDAQWGLLVEEGTRPRYGGTEARDDGDDGPDTGAPDAGGMSLDAVDERAGKQKQEQEQEREQERDQRSEKSASMVDKYRNCALRSVFALVASQTIRNVEEG